MTLFTRQFHPTTRDVRFDSARSSWRRGQPGAELVTACLATPLGEAGRDPSYGIDLSAVDNARPNAAALYRLAVERALSRYVQAGTLRDLQVTVTRGTTPQGDAALWARVQARGRDGEVIDTTVSYP